MLAEVAARFGPRIVGSDRELTTTRDAFDAYFAGEGDPHGLPVDLSLVAAPFRHAVLETLHDEVARGKVVTYGDLAAPGGQPARLPRGGDGLRPQPDPDPRPLPPRAAGRRRPRRLRRRAGAQARAAGARGRPDYRAVTFTEEMTTGSIGASVAGSVSTTPILSTTSWPLGHLAQQRVLRRELRVLGGDDEELAAGRAVGLGAGLGHRDDALACS